MIIVIINFYHIYNYLTDKTTLLAVMQLTAFFHRDFGCANVYASGNIMGFLSVRLTIYLTKHHIR